MESKVKSSCLLSIINTVLGHSLWPWTPGGMVFWQIFSRASSARTCLAYIKERKKGLREKKGERNGGREEEHRLWSGSEGWEFRQDPKQAVWVHPCQFTLRSENLRFPRPQPVRWAPPPGGRGESTLPRQTPFLQTFVVPVLNFYVRLATCPVKGII